MTTGRGSPSYDEVFDVVEEDYEKDPVFKTTIDNSPNRPATLYELGRPRYEARVKAGKVKPSTTKTLGGISGSQGPGTSSFTRLASLTPDKLAKMSDMEYKNYLKSLPPEELAALEGR